MVVCQSRSGDECVDAASFTAIRLWPGQLLGPRQGQGIVSPLAGDVVGLSAP